MGRGVRVRSPADEPGAAACEAQHPTATARVGTLLPVAARVASLSLGTGCGLDTTGSCGLVDFHGRGRRVGQGGVLAQDVDLLGVGWGWGVGLGLGMGLGLGLGLGIRAGNRVDVQVQVRVGVRIRVGVRGRASTSWPARPRRTGSRPHERSSTTRIRPPLRVACCTARVRADHSSTSAAMGRRKRCNSVSTWLGAG